MTRLSASWVFAALLLTAQAAFAETASITGTVRDETAAALPGVGVELRDGVGRSYITVSDVTGSYRFDAVPAGAAQISFTLVNFASVQREISTAPGGHIHLSEVVMHLSLSADVLVTGRNTFTNPADAENPAEDLVGMAQSASQGAITALQLGVRPLMRTGEVLETVPGVVISQHSGEGKANQYYLRGFNLDHGTDFATTVAGMPVNLPTHGHGHGYTDLNFLIPELVSGVQYSKGPYFAEQGDFATAGAANINYANALDRPIVRVSGGDGGYRRALMAGSRAFGGGWLLGGFETAHDDGPWDQPDSYRKYNGVLRYTRTGTVTALSLTGMAYGATWSSTDQIPRRGVDRGLIGRFGSLDRSDGGDTYRYSGSLEWQRLQGNAATRVTAYGVGYDLNLFSNFTFFLADPQHGDQFHQADHRFTTGAKVSQRRFSRWAGKVVQNTVGVQFRNDDIPTVGLYHTEARQLLNTVREDAVVQTSGGLFFQNETAWAPWLRSTTGARVDGYRFNVASDDPANSGIATAGLVSPKAGLVVGPFRGTEFYANAGFGFHSNDARGATMTRDPQSGEPADHVTPLVRARGSEIGVRTVTLPHLQSTVSVWTLALDSELLFVGDAGNTEAGRPSRRHGVEVANYYRPRPWLTLDGDLAWSHARFTDRNPVGDQIPGSVQTVVAGGATVDAGTGVFGSLRLRYFGPRPLIEDESARSKATTLLNLEVGYQFSPRLRLTLDVFNLTNAGDSDIDYFYASRLPGEPADGVDDVHFHPTLPRTARLGLSVAF